MKVIERIWRDVEFGHFTNSGLNGSPKGYRCDLYGYEKPHWWSASIPQYHFSLVMAHPFSYILGRQPAEFMGLPINTELQPSKEYDTDFGSVPSLLWCVYSPERFLSWLLHDSAYIFHYIWCREFGCELWYKLTLTRLQADKLFCQYGIGAQDGDAFDRAMIYDAVRIGGGSVWPKPGLQSKRG